MVRKYLRFEKHHQNCKTASCGPGQQLESDLKAPLVTDCELQWILLIHIHRSCSPWPLLACKALGWNLLKPGAASTCPGNAKYKLDNMQTNHFNELFRSGSKFLFAPKYHQGTVNTCPRYKPWSTAAAQTATQKGNLSNPKHPKSIALKNQLISSLIKTENKSH